MKRQNLCMTFIQKAKGRQSWQNLLCLTHDFCPATSPNLKLPLNREMRLTGSGIGKMPPEHLRRANPRHSTPGGLVSRIVGIAKQSSWARTLLLGEAEKGWIVCSLQCAFSPQVLRGNLQSALCPPYLQFLDKH